MALFRILKGAEANLADQKKREGFAYFTTDENDFYVDISSDDDSTSPKKEGVRRQLNANRARYLKSKSSDGSNNYDLYIDYEEISLGRLSGESNYETPYDGSTKKSGKRSIAIGDRASATGSYSSSFGTLTKAPGKNAHAEGDMTQAIKESSHAEGISTMASGEASHAEGIYSIAEGDYSHAEGNSTSEGLYSHSEGESTRASGGSSHAEGLSSIANGNYSHAQNRGTIASGESQTALGKYNIEDTTSALIIGNGTADNARSNILKIDWNGNAEISGTVVSTGDVTAPKFIGALQGNADSATKATKDNKNQTIDSTYIKDILIDTTSLNPKLKYKRGNDTTVSVSDIDYRVLQSKLYQYDSYSSIKIPLLLANPTTGVQKSNYNGNVYFYPDLNYVPDTGYLEGVKIDCGNWDSYDGNVDNCCFIAGTQILIDLDGNTKNIENMKPGDIAVSYDLNKQINYLAIVKDIYTKVDVTDIAVVTFDNGSQLTMNAYHPIYTSNGWHSLTNHKNYDTLLIGDICKTENGWSEIIDINRFNSKPIIMYSLDVVDIDEIYDNDVNDNFFANGIVVHNASCPT